MSLIPDPNLGDRFVKVTPEGHEWVNSTVGHGDYQCKWCLITNREAYAIGELNHPCPNRPKSAVAVQVGGSHYKQMVIQPLELGYANRYDACTYSAIKYVSRHQTKDGIEGLKKARHCVQFGLEMLLKHGHRACLNTIRMQQYVEENNFVGLERAVLLDLHSWGLKAPKNPQAAASLIVQKINALIAQNAGAGYV